MKLKEYIANLIAIVEENPSRLNLEVAYSKDDEGNGFHKVSMKPTIGLLTGEYSDLEFDSEVEEGEGNAIVIN